MNKHNEALKDIITLSKRLDLSFKDNVLILNESKKVTSREDLNILKRAVKNLGSIQVQELIKYFKEV